MQGRILPVSLSIRSIRVAICVKRAQICALLITSASAVFGASSLEETSEACLVDGLSATAVVGCSAPWVDEADDGELSNAVRINEDILFKLCKSLA